MTYELTHLQALEAEAIHIMREVAAEFERPVLLFSGGKDSIVLLRLAEKAFRPAPFPTPTMIVVPLVLGGAAFWNARRARRRERYRDLVGAPA